jgi:hypothetical protein
MARIIAFYLPQFHSIPENDMWWGKGFTEWTSVAKAKPLFKGHHQPNIPADLGFYDLRLPETRIAQAEMAKKYGIEGFCYWHYWFGNGKRLLERPFNEVLKSSSPNFPFSLAWANHSWEKKLWDSNGSSEILIEQLYPGIQDYRDHFYALLPAFKDPRYIKVNKKLFFIIYRPLDNPNDIKSFINVWQNLAKENGLNGFYFVGLAVTGKHKDKILNIGFDAVYNDSVMGVHSQLSYSRKILLFLRMKTFNRIRKFKYERAIKHFTSLEDSSITSIPTIIPRWDHSPRSGTNGVIFTNSTPELFKKHIKKVLRVISSKPSENQIAILKSWNEWGEGNYIEPDLEYGTQYLEVLSESINENNKDTL